MPSLKKSMRKPFEDWRKLLIASALMFAPGINLITGIFFYGYLLVYSNSVMKGKDKLPEWKDYGKLFKIGLRLILLNLAVCVPLAIMLIAVVLSTGFGISQAGVNFTAPDAVIYTLFGLALLVFMITAYIFPAIQLRLAKDLNVGRALDIGEAFRLAFRWDYFWTYLRTAAALFAASILVGIAMELFMFTYVVPLILEAFLIAASQIVYFSMFARLFFEQKGQ